MPVEDRPVLPNTREVFIDCPAHQTTRVVLPERVKGYRGDPGSEALLGLRVETRPRVVFNLQPTAYPLEGRYRVDGITRRLMLVFRIVREGGSREVRLRLAGSPTPHEEARPKGSGTTPAARQTKAPPPPEPAAGGSAAGSPIIPSSTAAQFEAGKGQATAEPLALDAHGPGTVPGRPEVEPQPTAAPQSPVVTRPTSSPPEVADPAHAAAGLLDPGILTARVRPIGRMESLPGQRPVELVDILEGNRYVWLRFSIGDARGAEIERIWWEHGAITTYATEPVDRGRQLAVVVQLPRRTEAGTALITRRTRLHLKLNDGERTFPLSAPWLGAVVKDIFGW